MRILSVRQIPHKNNYINLYKTTLGEMTSIEVADHLGIDKNLLFQRIKKYGLTDRRVIDPPWPGRPSSKRYGNPEW